METITMYEYQPAPGEPHTLTLDQRHDSETDPNPVKIQIPDNVEIGTDNWGVQHFYLKNENLPTTCTAHYNGKWYLYFPEIMTTTTEIE